MELAACETWVSDVIELRSGAACRDVKPDG